MSCLQPLALEVVIAGGLLCTLSSPAQQVARYEPKTGVSGTIRVWGSPQMQDLLVWYEKGFLNLQPDVQFRNELKSTLVAVPGVYTGRADIGLLGREIWPTETQAFRAVLGRPPKVIDIATGSYDVPKATYALMVFVHSSNPVRSLSTRQLERIFGSSVYRVRTWGELGVGGPRANRPVHLYGFSTDNDKAQIFRQLVFAQHEDWNDSLRQFRNDAGSEADAGAQIVKAVAHDPDAIGISNVHYATAAVKAVPLTTEGHPAPIAPSRDNVASRRYPLTRAVYMVVDPEALRKSPALCEFLRYVLSEQGSEAVTREGEYLPLPPEVAARELHDLNGD
jgi:phosphate transport system substrate-binding protein